MKSSELYDLGYCIPQFQINRDIQSFMYKNECFDVKAGSVVMYHLPEISVLFKLAKIDDVRKAHEDLKRSRAASNENRDVATQSQKESVSSS